MRLPEMFLVPTLRVGTARRTAIRAAIVGVLAAMCLPTALSATEPAARPVWPFFAFDSGTKRDGLSFDQQAQLLKDLGYDGIAFDGVKHIPEMLKALDARGLKMFSIYTPVNVDPGKPAYDPGLKQAIGQLARRGTQIWLTISGGKPSSDTSDDRAVALLREIADMARPAGLPVAVYPHAGCYAQRVGDALRLVKKAGRKNLGVCFNLCHFLILEDEKNLDERLTEAAPYLHCVNINGADSGETTKMGWKRLIQTLDRGSFDVGRVLRTLDRLGYIGPVGLQCFAVPGTARDILGRSIAAWRKLAASVAPVTPKPSGNETKPATTWPLFVFDNGTGGPDVPFDQQAGLLKELGYDGIAYCGRLPLPRLPEMLKAVDDKGIKMYMVYTGVYVEPIKPEDRGRAPYDPILKTVIKQLKGRSETQIWLPIVGGKPRATDQDEHVVRVLREIAELADQSGLKVAIYPHINWYAERYEDAIRLAKKVDRKNLGVVFNLSHFMIRDDDTLLEQRLPQAGPLLMGVSINGADHGYRYSPDWKHLILTLDRGDYDLGRVLRTLDKMGYHGPIGIQCHDMTGDPRENLTHSMKGWRKLTGQ